MNFKYLIVILSVLVVVLAQSYSSKLPPNEFIYANTNSNVATSTSIAYTTRPFPTSTVTVANVVTTTTTRSTRSSKTTPFVYYTTIGKSLPQSMRASLLSQTVPMTVDATIPTNSILKNYSYSYETTTAVNTINTRIRKTSKTTPSIFYTTIGKSLPQSMRMTASEIKTVPMTTTPTSTTINSTTRSAKTTPTITYTTIIKTVTTTTTYAKTVPEEYVVSTKTVPNNYETTTTTTSAKTVPNSYVTTTTTNAKTVPNYYVTTTSTSVAKTVPSSIISSSSSTRSSKTTPSVYYMTGSKTIKVRYTTTSTTTTTTTSAKTIPSTENVATTTTTLTAQPTYDPTTYDYFSCSENDWICKNKMATQCYNDASDCWKKDYSPTLSDECSAIASLCEKIW